MPGLEGELNVEILTNHLSKELSFPAWLADSVNTYRATLVDRLRASGWAVTPSEVCTTEDGRPVWVRVLQVQLAS